MEGIFVGTNNDKLPTEERTLEEILRDEDEDEDEDEKEEDLDIYKEITKIVNEYHNPLIKRESNYEIIEIKKGNGSSKPIPIPNPNNK
jgi:hypothetical protein